MGDKVEALMEKMVDELLYYKNEEIFSTKEVKKLVKARRGHEY
jgi:U3 small nucleolar RNA-associated protein 6